MTTTRKQYGPKFKPKVAVEAIRGERTLSQLASQYHVHPVSDWPVAQDRTGAEGGSVYGRPLPQASRPGCPRRKPCTSRSVG